MDDASILLVVDNPDEEDLMRRALQRRSIANAVMVARDGLEALDYLFCRGKFEQRGASGKLPAVVLLAPELPRLGGFEVLKQIRANARTSMLPVVILTSSGEEEDVVRSYRSGANSCVRKPFNFAEFISAVAQLGVYWLFLNRPPRSA